MTSVWLDLNIGQIVEEDIDEKFLDVIEKPEHTERMEITRLDGELHITPEVAVGLHTMLNIAIQRANLTLQMKTKGGSGSTE